MSGRQRELHRSHLPPCIITTPIPWALTTPPVHDYDYDAGVFGVCVFLVLDTRKRILLVSPPSPFSDFARTDCSVFPPCTFPFFFFFFFRLQT